MFKLNLYNNTVITTVMISETLKTVGISGSLRKRSYNRLLLENLFSMLPYYVKGEILDLKDIPVYNQDDETNTPYSVKLIKEKIRNADLIFITTPEYNHSISGVLKNAIDWLSRPSLENLFEWKTVAVLSASTGMIGGARAQEDLKRIMEPLGAIIVPRPEVILTSADKKFDSNGHITDQIAVQLMSSLIKNSIRLSLALKNSANVETLANIIYKS